MVEASPEQSSSDIRGLPRQVVKSFRLDAAVARQLDDLAEREGVSVNSVVNKLVKKYVEWDSYAEKFDLQSFSGSLLRHLADKLSENDMHSLGRWWAENRASEYSELWYGTENLETMINVFTLMSRYGRRFSFQVVQKPDREVILLINHGLGTKWSEFYATILKAWLGRMKTGEVVRSEVKSSENQVVARITTKETGHANLSPSQTLQRSNLLSEH